MRQLGFPHAASVDRFCRQVDDFLAAASSLDELELLTPSLCLGWSRLEVVAHVRMGLQEMATGALQRTDEVPDHDAASYWLSHPDDREHDPVAHIMWLRRVASAHARPSGALTQLRAVAEAVKGAVRALPPGAVAFQGKRLSTGDFLATWVVELAVHQLDLGLDDEPSGIGWARQTVEAIAGDALPADLADGRAVLIALGRAPCPSGIDLAPAFPLSL